MSTKLSEENIEPGTLTEDLFESGIFSGGGGTDLTITNFSITDSSFTPIANTNSVSSSATNYFKITGTGFTSGLTIAISSNNGFFWYSPSNTVTSTSITYTVPSSSVSAGSYDVVISQENGKYLYLNQSTTFT